MEGEEALKKIVKDMLSGIGEDPSREGLRDTPTRVTKMWKEIYRGYDPTQRPKVTTFNNGSDGITYDQMITDSGNYYSQCEHHMVPFFGHYWFAYIPHPQGKLLGLSKVARVVDFFSAKLQVQERLVHEIVEYLWQELCKDTKYAPLGIALVMKGKHLCKCSRGVKKDGNMITSVMRGEFRKVEVKDEFLKLIGGELNGKD